MRYVNTLIDCLPIFYSFGISRLELLKMRHWEVIEIISGHYKHRARLVLDLTDAVALGAGWGDAESKEQMQRNLVDKAGFPRRKTKVSKKFTGKSWTSDLMTAL